MNKISKCIQFTIENKIESHVRKKEDESKANLSTFLKILGYWILLNF